MRSADRHHQRVVKSEQLPDGHVTANCDIADEIDARCLGNLVVALANCLQRLMVRCHAETDQPVGHRVAIDDVDLRGFAIGLAQRLGGIEARGPRSDHCEVPHEWSQSLLLLSSSSTSLPFRVSAAWIAGAKIASIPGSNTLQRTNASWTVISACTAWPIAWMLRFSASPAHIDSTCAEPPGM